MTDDERMIANMNCHHRFVVSPEDMILEKLANCEQGTQTHLGLIVVISGIEIYVYMYILKYIEKTLKCIEISWIMNYASQNKGLQKTSKNGHHLGFMNFFVELDDPQNLQTDPQIPKNSTGKLKNSVIADRTWFA